MITHFDTGTPDAVKNALLRLQTTGEVARLFYGYTNPNERLCGLAWAESNDVYGRIGNSTGPRKVAILVAPQAHGGPAILTANIVAIKTANGWLYRHPNFQTGAWATSLDGLSVYRDNLLEAYFPTRTRAQRFIAFMTGQRLNR